MSDATEKISDATQEFVKNSVDQVKNNTVSVLIFGVVCLVTFYVLFHLFRIFKKTDLKTVTFLKKATRIPTASLKKINDDDMPVLYNGNEYAYSIWMYIEQVSPSFNPKLIYFRNSGEMLRGASPILYMDPDFVRMHILIKTSSEVSSTKRDTLKEIHENLDCDYLKLTVNYVPMQRWVNVIVVVDNEYIQLFFDGELRKVIDVTDTKNMIENYNHSTGTDHDSTYLEKYKCTDSDGNRILNGCCNERNKCCGTRSVTADSGNMYIGRHQLNESVEGFVSKVQFFNYAVTIDHARLIYQSGPLHKSIFSYFGLPLYGIRNPVYKLGEISECEKTEEDDEE